MSWKIEAGTRVMLCLIATGALLLAGAAVAIGWLGSDIFNWIIPSWAGVLTAYITFRGVEKRGK
ncbi:MAG: hypothetical protein GY832_30960 [Chloroflexi bacterium]|nr:hypothetical protein [Chloroflexota bacterium]